MTDFLQCWVQYCSWLNETNLQSWMSDGNLTCSRTSENSFFFLSASNTFLFVGSIKQGSWRLNSPTVVMLKHFFFFSFSCSQIFLRRSSKRDMLSNNYSFHLSYCFKELFHQNQVSRNFPALYLTSIIFHSGLHKKLYNFLKFLFSSSKAHISFSISRFDWWMKSDRL